METHFDNGNLISPYMATGYAEGFEQAENPMDVIRAWSYLIGTGMHYTLQGSFGRMAQSMINKNVIDNDGVVDWELVEEKFANQLN